jgi:hypothetical protein
MSDIKTIISNIYTTFAGEVVTAIGTDSKQLLTTGAGYLADAKSSLTAIGMAALAPTDPMSWQEVKLKLAAEGKIAEAAFISVEQQLASDLQSFVNSIITLFESLLTNQLLQLQAPTQAP